MCSTKWKRCLLKMSVCLCDRERWDEQEVLGRERGGAGVVFAHGVHVCE